MATAEALYYPFSRCIDETALKQFLLLFDSVTFLDPVDDDEWRGQLFEDVEGHHDGYRAYRDLAQYMPLLRQEGVIKVQSPLGLRGLNSDLTVAATLSDLADHNWVAQADPRRFKMPTQYVDGAPAWNVFKPKLPTKFVDALVNDDGLRQHLLSMGGDRFAWELSYAAGSSVGINVHLAAAEELALAPITDSQLHHDLMLQKLARATNGGASPSQFEDIAEAVAQRTVFKIIDTILPASRVADLPLEDILRFRQDTKALRGAFLDDVSRIVMARIDAGRANESAKVVAQVTQELMDSARTYGADISSSRDKLWPKMLEGFNSALPATSIAALAGSYITHSGHVLAASVIVQSLAPLKAALEWRADAKRTERSARTSIAYISRVKQL